MSEGPFCSDAFQLNKRGMIVLPIEPGGKKPVVQKWNKWETQKEQSVLAFAQQFREANLALICGASGLTVIDLDDPTLLEYAIERFGDTPLQVATPRGGVHLYYRNNGEGCPAHIRKNEHLQIDVRGTGGYVLAPPSVVSGKAYRISKGSWDCLGQLPFLRENALKPQSTSPNSPIGEDEKENTGKKPISKMVEADGRNAKLFDLAREKAATIEAFDEFKDWAQTQNNQFAQPMSPTEVGKIVRSVWNYKEEGTLTLSNKPFVRITHEELDALGSNAMHLLMVLRRNHSPRQKRGEHFAIACQAMAKKNVIRGWTPYRFTQARDELIANNIIQCVGRHIHNKMLKQYGFVI